MLRFTPNLTVLDDRYCPSGSAIIAGNALYITTDPASDAVLIHDDGRGDVYATVRGQGTVEYARGSGINEIFVQLHGTHDQLDFALLGPAVSPVSVVVALGNGGQNHARFELPYAPTPGDLTIDLRGTPDHGGVDVWEGPGGLGTVDVLNHLNGGKINFHAPRAEYVGNAQV